jgi:hypothetical protein
VAISCSADRGWARGRHSIQETGNRVFSLGHEQERDDATWKGGQVRNRREIPPLRRPTRSQEANAEEKSRSAPVGMTVWAGSGVAGCSGRNDGAARILKMLGAGAQSKRDSSTTQTDAFAGSERGRKKSACSGRNDGAGSVGIGVRGAPVGMTVGEGFHPQVQVQACGGKQSFGENLATVVLHAVADLPVVNIQLNVIHRFHGGASLVF